MGETLNLLFRRRDDGSYELQVRVGGSEEVVSGDFIPPYTTRQLNRLLSRIKTLDSDDQELREIGQRLFQALCGSEPPRANRTRAVQPSIQATLRGSIQRILHRRGTLALTLCFAPDCEGFARYPWELLHNGEHFLLASGVFTLTRAFLRPDMPTGCELPVYPPLRLLYIGASPRDLPPLETERSFSSLERGLSRLIEEDQVLLDRLPQQTFDELVRYLNSVGGAGAFEENKNSIPCYAIHFDGHGAYGRLCPAEACDKLNDAGARTCAVCGTSLQHVEPQTYLCFCNEQGFNHFIGTEALRDVFLSSDVRLAVFSACETATLAASILPANGTGGGNQTGRPYSTQAGRKESDGNTNHRSRRPAVDATLATSLVNAQVPAVVAMPFSLQDDLSSTFMFHFYEALADGRTLEEALSRARQAMLATKHSSWFVPVLYRQVVEGQEEPVAFLADQHELQAHEPFSYFDASNTFVGRDRELGDLSSLLTQIVGSQGQSGPLLKSPHKLKPGVHHLALTGPAGIGKSALAFEVVRRNQKKFPGGIVVLSLQGGKSFGDALLEIAAHLRLSPDALRSANVNYLEQLVLNTLRGLSNRELPSLLVLDRFDEVQEHRTLGKWHRFLCALPEQVAVLVTSHSNPAILAAVEGALCQWYEYRVDKMTSADLLKLFTELAEANGLAERIQLGDPQQQTVLQEICDLLDGYPLGAELIFGRARTIGGKIYRPEAATRSLEEVRDELREKQPEGIWALLDMAYQLLSKPAQLLLPYLVAFKLPFSHQQIAMLVEPKATATVRTAMRLESEHVRAEMHAEGQDVPLAAASTIPVELQHNWGGARDELVDASFMQFDGRLYNIHAQVRQFAHTLLPPEEHRRVHRVAAAYYSGLAHPTPEEWFAAFEHLQEAGEAEDLHKAIHLAVSAAQALRGRGRASKLRDILGRANVFAQELGDKTGEGQIQYYLGTILRQLGLYPEAIGCLTRSADLLREQDERDLVAWTLEELAMLFREEGQYKKAAQHAQQALALFQEVGDAAGMAWMQLILGEVSRDDGRYHKAEEYFRLALDSFLALNNDEGYASVLRNRGTIHEAFGRYPEALTDYEESLRLFTALSQRSWQAWVFTNQSTVYLDQRKFEEAERICSQAIAIFREQHTRRGEAWALRVIGDIARKKRNFDDAGSYYEDAFNMFSALGDRIEQARIMNARGAIAFEEGKLTLAKDQFERAYAITHDQQVPQIEVRSLRGLGDVALAQHHLADAERSFNAAAALAEQLDTPAERRAVLRRQGELSLAQNKCSEALQAWVKALSLDRRTDHPERNALQKKVDDLVAEHGLQARYAELRKEFGLE